MAQMVNVDKAISKLVSNFKNLESGQLISATVSAINHTLGKGRTEARKAVKGEYNIPQKNLSGIDRIRARRNFLIGYVVASSKPIPADAFSPKFETPTGSVTISRKGETKQRQFGRKKKNVNKGVSIEVHKGSRQVIPYAFMIASAKPRVFARGQYRSGGGSYGFVQRNKRVNRTGTDTPIKPLLSVTVHAAVINNKVEKNIAGVIIPSFSNRMEHELKRQIDKIKG